MGRLDCARANNAMTNVISTGYNEIDGAEVDYARIDNARVDYT